MIIDNSYNRLSAYILIGSTTGSYIRTCVCCTYQDNGPLLIDGICPCNSYIRTKLYPVQVIEC